MLPGSATRSQNRMRSGGSKLLARSLSSSQVTYTRPSGPIVTSPNWRLFWAPLIKMGAVQLVSLASQRTPLIWLVNGGEQSGLGQSRA